MEKTLCFQSRVQIQSMVKELGPHMLGETAGRTKTIILIIKLINGVPGGTMNKNPANTGDMRLTPGPGRFYMPQSN